MFGNPNPFSPSGDGRSTNPTFSFGNASAHQGTPVKFKPLTGDDEMMNNGCASSNKTRYQSISCMQEYTDKSFEEIRLEDYLLNRKGTIKPFGFEPFQNLNQQTVRSLPFGPTSTPQGQGQGSDTEAYSGMFRYAGEATPFKFESLFAKDPAISAPPFGFTSGFTNTSPRNSFSFGNGVFRTGTFGGGNGTSGSSAAPPNSNLVGERNNVTIPIGGLFGPSLFGSSQGQPASSFTLEHVRAQVDQTPRAPPQPLNRDHTVPTDGFLFSAPQPPQDIFPFAVPSTSGIGISGSTNTHPSIPSGFNFSPPTGFSLGSFGGLGDLSTTANPFSVSIDIDTTSGPGLPPPPALSQTQPSGEIKSCGIINTREGYYTRPSVAELDTYVDEEGKCQYYGFTVGRENYGEILFCAEINLAGLNIDELVHINHMEVEVYPDETNKPPQGEGLNVPAEILLKRVWPMDTNTNQPITDPIQLDALGFENVLRGVCQALQADFLSYIPCGGLWYFKTSHFSKYGCNVSGIPVEMSKKSDEGVVKALGAMSMDD